MQYNYCSSVKTIEVNIILTRKTNVFVCKKRELETKMIHTECSLLYSSRKTAWQFIIYFSCQLQCAVLWKTSLILHMVDFLRGNICQEFANCIFGVVKFLSCVWDTAPSLSPTLKLWMSVTSLLACRQWKQHRLQLCNQLLQARHRTGVSAPVTAVNGVAHPKINNWRMYLHKHR